MQTQTQHSFRDVEAHSHTSRSQSLTVLYTAAAIAAFSAIAYELLLASYATFLMGATIYQYSLVISLMMASMGVGSFIVGKFREAPLVVFLNVEFSLAAIAAVSVPTLYFVFSKDIFPRLTLIGFVLVIGAAVGMEIPLLNQMDGSKKSLSRILFFDYLGGFAGGLAFPIWLLPKLGFFRLGAVLCTLNTATAFILVYFFRRQLGSKLRYFLTIATLIGVVAVLALLYAEPLRQWMELKLFGIRQLP